MKWEHLDELLSEAPAPAPAPATTGTARVAPSLTSRPTRARTVDETIKLSELVGMLTNGQKTSSEIAPHLLKLIEAVESNFSAFGAKEEVALPAAIFFKNSGDPTEQKLLHSFFKNTGLLNGILSYGPESSRLTQVTNKINKVSSAIASAAGAAKTSGGIGGLGAGKISSF